MEIRPVLQQSVRWSAETVVPGATRFSKWTVLIRCMATILKFTDIQRKKVFPGRLEEAELLRAIAAIFRDVQQTLPTDPGIENFLRTLTPFRDEDGVLRMRVTRQ